MINYCVLCRRTLEVWNRSVVNPKGCKWCYPDYQLDTPKKGLCEGELEVLSDGMKRTPDKKVLRRNVSSGRTFKNKYDKGGRK